MAKTRTERDSMGEIDVPAEAYYGASTERARRTFQVSSLRFSRRFLWALGLVKAAAARVNTSLGLLPAEVGEAIEKAALEVAGGKFDAEFVVDVFQTGSGTSTNMNANEVIATRARELLGRDRADRAAVHPNDHVNLGQSTNDVFPTAIHVAALAELERHTLPAMAELADAFEQKATEFSAIVKAGRTHLQDAVPMTLGQEFSGYASVIRHGIVRLENTRLHVAELPLGGTAVGTGLNAHPEFAPRVIAELRRLTGLMFTRAKNAFEALQQRDAAVELSGAVRTVAVGLMKIANDLRLLSSGPRTGFAEIELPATQPGSSIMPGKVNPVVPEAVNMVCARLIGNDATIAIAGLNGNLELNTMMPILAYTLLDSLELLGNAARLLAEKCVRGIRADAERCRQHAERSLALVTAVAPRIGYDEAARIYKLALERDLSIREVLRAEGKLSPAEIEELLDLERMTRGGRV
ncbi:MAG: fumarate hydratase class II [Candidatus Binatia bacterium]|nr:MAG: fumarate hydratase class II [Candidatus Binatia bacterium]